MFKGAIFDNDGVIVDNLSYHYKAFREFIGQYGITVSDSTLDSLNGMGNEDIIPKLLPKEIVEKYGVEYLSNQKESIYRRIYAPVAKPVNGLANLLQEFRHNGVLCAVGSSGMQKNVEMVLTRCKIDYLFDVAINGDQVSHCKPDPEIYLTAARELGLEASECVVFEDSINGIKAARNANMKVIALTTTHTRQMILEHIEPDMFIEDFTQIDYDHINSLFS